MRGKYKRWAFQERQADAYYAQLNRITAALAEEMCALEDARFLRRVDAVIASGRRLYYRKK
jgi:hypothetical protein